MKLFKQITCAVLTLCLCAGLLLIPSAPVSAATGPSAPKAVELFLITKIIRWSMIRLSPYSSVQTEKTSKNIKTSSKKPESQSNKTFTFQLQ